MPRLTASSIVAAAVAATLLTLWSPSPVPAADEPAKQAAAAGGEWVNLLEGGDLTKHWKTTGNWKLGADGVVQLEPREGEKGWTRYDAYLWLSDQQYTDFEIQFDYKINKGGNSGFYFRVGDLKEPVGKGIEVQISDSHGKDKLNDHTAGGIIPGVPPTKNAAKPAGEWNHFAITVKGDKLTVVLNGETVNEVDLTQGKLASRPKTGHLGFQDHGLPLWLKDVKVRELKYRRHPRCG